MDDILDTIKLWAAASLAALVGGTAFSLAPYLPAPLTVALWLSGGVCVAAASIYYVAGIISAKHGLRTMRGGNHA